MNNFPVEETAVTREKGSRILELKDVETLKSKVVYSAVQFQELRDKDILFINLTTEMIITIIFEYYHHHLTP